MLNSLTTSAHNSLSSSEVSKLLTGALLLAAAALTGCSSTSVASADLSSTDTYISAPAVNVSDPADTTRAYVPTHHHSNVRDLSRVELSPRQLAAVHTL